MAKNVDFKKLFLSILFDLIGLLSFTIPGVGEFSDIVWAPLSFWLMTKMYQGSLGKISGFINFVEEAFPGMDFIPTFTLTWFYEQLLKKKTLVN